MAANNGIMRRVIDYSQSTGVMHLECGHVANKEPGPRFPARVRCANCTPAERRLQSVRRG